MSGTDPGLTRDGQKRAESLVHLQEAFSTEISGIYTSNAKRTKETAAPSSRAFDLPVVSDIPKRDIEALVSDILLRHESKSVLVVGHTSTIPKVIRQFSKRLGDFRISEQNFSRLFRLKVEDGKLKELVEYRYEPTAGGIDLVEVL